MQNRYKLIICIILSNIFLFLLISNNEEEVHKVREGYVIVEIETESVGEISSAAYLLWNDDSKKIISPVWPINNSANRIEIPLTQLTTLAKELSGRWHLLPADFADQLKPKEKKRMTYEIIF